MRRTLTLLIAVTSIAILFAGCGSTYYLKSSSNSKPSAGEKRVVYVTNPDLSREFAILKASGIYSCTNREQTASRLTLHPVRQFGRCGNPMLITIYTLGVVPGYLKADQEFSYDLEVDGHKETVFHILSLDERFSLWDGMIPQNKVSIFGKALRNSSPIVKPIGTLHIETIVPIQP